MTADEDVIQHRATILFLQQQLGDWERAAQVVATHPKVKRRMKTLDKSAREAGYDGDPRTGAEFFQDAVLSALEE